MNLISAAIYPHGLNTLILLRGGLVHYPIQAVLARGSHTPPTEPPVEPPLPEPSVDNTMTLSASVAATDVPVRFGRAFVQGEVVGFAQVLLNGEPIPTQCDVKNRWPDGSLKFAVIAIVVPVLEAGVPVTVQFVDVDDGNNEPSAVPSLDAGMILTSSITSVSVHVQDMLDEGNYELWTSGPIAQTYVCYDRSAERVYDIGFSAYRPFHPWFVVTHWPGLGKTHIRFVGEIANTEAMEAQTYNLDLTVDGVGVYSQDGIAHRPATRWTRTAWHGGAPETKINLYHNVAYLAQTGLVPNYDSALVVPATTIANRYAHWLTLNRNIGGAGGWQIAMPTTGGRYDIGLNPAWYASALITGDYRDREIMLGQAELAGWWQGFMREGDPAKANFGRTAHCHTRGTYWFLDNRVTPSAADAVTIINPGASNGWNMDDAHQPDPHSLPYLMTGDPYWLDGLEMWHGRNSLGTNPGYRNYNNMTVYGSGQIRAMGWTYRTMFNAAALLPDDDPLKPVFRQMIDEAIAKDEGQRGINNTQFNGTPQHTFGKKGIGTPGDGWNGRGPPPCRWWAGGAPYDATNPVYFDLAITKNTENHWQNMYVICGLGRGRALGYPSNALVEWIAPHVIGQLGTDGYPPQLTSQNTVPSVKYPGVWFTSWLDVLTGWSAEKQTGMLDGQIDMLYWGQPVSYYNYARCALSLVIDQPGGAEAWESCEATIAAKTEEVGYGIRWTDDPTWAVIP